MNEASNLENKKYDRGDVARTMQTLYPQKLALTSPTSGRAVGTVCSWTKATEGFF
jgi:hypothetical protein